MRFFGGYPPYVTVAKRREQAAKEVAKLVRKGRAIAPVVITGRMIARSFWGKAWCNTLESYADYDSRLPRGRTYVRNGSVIDLQIAKGEVTALVSGSEIYTVKITIATVAVARWKSICSECHGSIGSLVELLQGKLSKNVMERVCRPVDGLFPSSKDIKMKCSCYDWAAMCKHAAAALYGIGARLDTDPGLIFTLRGVDRADLVTASGDGLSVTKTSKRRLSDDDVAALFGINMEPDAAAVMRKPVPKQKPLAPKTAKTTATRK